MNPNDVKAALDAIQQALTSFTASLQALTSTVGQLNQQTTQAQQSFSNLDKWLGMVSTSAVRAQVGLAIFVTGLEKALNSLGNQFTKFVQLASPATVILFNRAMDNLMSAFGQVLTPVLQKMTPIVQALADAIVSLDEPAKKLLQTLAIASIIAGVVAGIAVAIAAVVSVLAPWVTALIALGAVLTAAVITFVDFEEVMDSLNDVLKVVGNAFQAIAKPIMGLISTLAEAFAGLMDALSPAIDSIVDFGVIILEALFAPINIVMQSFKMIMQVVSPVIKILGLISKIFVSIYEAVAKLISGGLQKLAELMMGPVVMAVEAVAEALAWLVDKMEWAVSRVRKLWGLDEGKFDPKDKRAQAVVKSASIGDVQSFLNKAYTSAATGNGITIQQAQLKKLSEIDESIKGLPQGIGGVVGAFIGGLLPKDAGSNAAEIGSGIFGGIGKAAGAGDNGAADIGKDIGKNISATIKELMQQGGEQRDVGSPVLDFLRQMGGQRGGTAAAESAASGVWDGWRKSFS